MSTLKITTKDDLHLPFQRYPVEHPIASVLLLHGASAASTTFITPPVSREYTNLVAYLNAAKLDVWTLDWRGSNEVAATQIGKNAVFSINVAAEYDVPPAVAHIRRVMRSENRSEQKLGALGHCLGGGVLAAAIADGRLVGEAKIDNAVLSALGLFYASPWDGCVKVQDYIIEQVLAEDPPKPTIDVGVPPKPFPPPMGQAYDKWPETLRVHCCTEVCFQVSFMFGHPYTEANLVSGIHNNQRLEELFNHMHLTLYVHCGQNLRRGMYAALDQTEDRIQCPAPKAGPFEMPVTLITGEENTLWHRECLDRMHEWLRSNGKNSQKNVLSGFGHQDLLWGKRSAEVVFPLALTGLLRT